MWEILLDLKSNIEWGAEQIPGVVSIVKPIIISMVLLIIGRKLIQVAIKFIKIYFERLHVEKGAAKFLTSLCNILLYSLLIIYISQTFLGLQASTIIAIVGSAGLAIGLSLQGSLANFAGGVLILIMKPFVMGDYIIAGDNEGTVVGIDVIYTRLLTPDNRKVVLPNGGLANSNIINVTNEPIRRLDIDVSIHYSENITKVKELLESLLQGHDMILHEKPIEIFVNGFEASSISMGFRVWVKTEEYWKLRWELLEEVKDTFDENGIEIPYDQMEVRINTDSE